MRVPSGDQTALASSAGLDVSRFVASPSRLTTARSPLPRRPVSNRTQRPLGDHWGALSAARRGSPVPRVPSVRRTGWPPAEGTLQIAPPPTKAIDWPSADQSSALLPP